MTARRSSGIAPIAVATALVLLAPACAGDVSTDDGRLRVVTTVYPVAEAAARVGGDLVRALREPLGHERAMASPSDDEAGVLELTVGPCHRVRRQAEVGREHADRGQPLPRPEPAALDPRRQAVAQLRRQRHARRRVQGDPHGAIMRRG